MHQQQQPSFDRGAAHYIWDRAYIITSAASLPRGRVYACHVCFCVAPSCHKVHWPHSDVERRIRNVCVCIWLYS